MGFPVERCGEDGAVRLVGGVTMRNMTEGRLEICVGGFWGTVCNDAATGIDDPFDINAAIVVCKQLGFSGRRKLFKINTINAAVISN